jgi:hypothetical protein
MDAEYLLPEKHGEKILPMREEGLSPPLQELSGIPGKGIQTRNCYQKARRSGSHEHTVDESLFRISHSLHMFPRWQFVGSQEHLPAWPTPVFLYIC